MYKTTLMFSRLFWLTRLENSVVEQELFTDVIMRQQS